MPKSEGYVYRQLLKAYRDAVSVYGIEGARRIAKEIISDARNKP